VCIAGTAFLDDIQLRVYVHFRARNVCQSKCNCLLIYYLSSPRQSAYYLCYCKWLTSRRMVSRLV